jgi:hypothetical protein
MNAFTNLEEVLVKAAVIKEESGSFIWWAKISVV